MESGCSRLHIVSTGNGEGDAFAALYENAQGGTRRLPVAVHPLRLPTRVVTTTGIAVTSKRRPTPRVLVANMPG